MQIVLIIIIAMAILFTLGPKVKIPALEDLPEIKIPDIENLENYIEEKEKNVANLRDHARAEIRWFDSKRKTEYAILYLHGFTANKMETEPLTTELGQALSANIYFSRLSGHGRAFDAMAEPDAKDWLLDAVEAYKIAQRIGEKIIVIGVSTGGTIAALLAEKYASMDSYNTIYIMISPNFAPKDKRAEALLWPWGKQLGLIISGKYRWWKLQNEMHEKYWTWKYPTIALLPMMALVKAARKIDFDKIENPILIFYSEEDKVVEPEETKALFEKIGSQNKRMIEIKDCGDRDNHVLAGDALSPNTTGFVRDKAHEFIMSNFKDS